MAEALTPEQLAVAQAIVDRLAELDEGVAVRMVTEVIAAEWGVQAPPRTEQQETTLAVLRHRRRQ